MIFSYAYSFVNNYSHKRKASKDDLKIFTAAIKKNHN